VLLLPNFVFGSTGEINVPLNFLASLALHLDGTVVLFQYLFGHRYNLDSCRYCNTAWHPIDDASRDSFHRPVSARVGQWWRRSFIDDRSYITATADPENTTTRETTTDSEKISEEGDDVSVHDSQGRRSQPRPSMRPVELPTPLLRLEFQLPRPPIRAGDDGSGSQSNNTERSSRETSSASSQQRSRSRSAYRSLRRKSQRAALSRTTLGPTQGIVPAVPERLPSSQLASVVHDDAGDRRAVNRDRLNKSAKRVSLFSSLSDVSQSPRRSSLVATRRRSKIRKTSNSSRSGVVIRASLLSIEDSMLQQHPPPPIPEPTTQVAREAVHASHKAQRLTTSTLPRVRKDTKAVRSGSSHAAVPKLARSRRTAAVNDTSQYSNDGSEMSGHILGTWGNGKREISGSHSSSGSSVKTFSPHRQGMI
jgi:hypothetical protein